MNWLYNMIDRLRCQHKWVKIREWDIIEHNEPISFAYKMGGQLVGKRTDYCCSECKSEKSVRASW